jgi:hypothetical protein
MTGNPIASLDDRLGFVGVTGSGKTYCASACVERLLDSGARVVIIDPLDVWWGLRLIADGSAPSRYAMPIFGGARGDLPINEHAGALVGETVSGMAESCIVSLGGLATKAAERRFMLAFLDAIYRRANGEPVHLIFDEADLWAPQRALEPMLQSKMEEICRRGRVRGLIPWLITQRPAVISKDVLSQVDGLVAFKLTSSQDRDALEGWIEGQADRQQWKEIRAALPTLQQGHGVVWIPGRGVLETAAFPPKRTFDSSRTPKRGERRETATLKPLDLGALKARLATVEAEAQANDPRALKAEIAKLKAELARPRAGGDDAVLRAEIARLGTEMLEAEKRGFDRAMEGVGVWFRRGAEATAERFKNALVGVSEGPDFHTFLLKELETWRGIGATEYTPEPNEPMRRINGAARPAESADQAVPARREREAIAAPARAQNEGVADLTGPQRLFLKSMAWWKAMGHPTVTRAQLAAIAGWRVTSGHLKNVAGSLSSRGLIEYPQPGMFAFTPAGESAAPSPDLSADFHESLRSTLNGPQRIAFDNLLKARKPISRDELAAKCGWEPTSGHVKNVIGSLSTLEIVEYPRPGVVALQDWVGLQ